MAAARLLFDHVRAARPDVYEALLQKIVPHDIESVIRIFDRHLRRRVPDLTCFNENVEAVPEFVWAFVKHMRFPTPGDAFGINLTCRITKSNTQGTLDSKHLSASGRAPLRFHVEKDVLNELAIFSTQAQVFELANRHAYATIFMKTEPLLEDACVLEKGAPFNKGRSIANGEHRYLSHFRYVVAKDRGSVKVLYRSVRDLFRLTRRVSLCQMAAFSDVRNVFQKCGIVVHFFNMVELAKRQLLANDGSPYEHDVFTLIKYQCRSGRPLSMTRDGLAKNPDRTPIEVLSFEAPKKNYARFCTGSSRGKWVDVETSADKVFFGEQFNEGTGYSFALMPKRRRLDTQSPIASPLDAPALGRRSSIRPS